MTHMHITSWVVALILFFVAISLQKGGKEKGAKIVQMVLRLFYLFILATGLMLLFQITTISGTYILKGLAGLLAIGMMEMVLGRTKKGQSSPMFWVLLLVFLALAIYLGFTLPL